MVAKKVHIVALGLWAGDNAEPCPKVCNFVHVSEEPPVNDEYGNSFCTAHWPEHTLYVVMIYLKVWLMLTMHWYVCLSQLLQDNKEIIAEDEQVFLMKQQATIRNAAQGKPVGE